MIWGYDAMVDCVGVIKLSTQRTTVKFTKTEWLVRRNIHHSCVSWLSTVISQVTLLGAMYGELFLYV